jgi:hypothetical protein
MIMEQLAFLWSDTYQHNGIIDKLTKSAEYILDVMNAQMAITYIDLSGDRIRTLESYVIVMRQMASYCFCHNDLPSALAVNKDLITMLDNISYDFDSYKKEIYENMMRIHQSFISKNFDKENSLHQITLLQAEVESINSKLSQTADLHDEINAVSMDMMLDSDDFPLQLERLNQICEKAEEELTYCAYGKDKYRICEELELIAMVYTRGAGDHFSRNEDFVKNLEVVATVKKIIDQLNAEKYKIKNEIYFAFYHLSMLTDSRCGRFEACMEDSRNLLKILEKGTDLAQETPGNYTYIRYFAYVGIASMSQKINPPDYQAAYDNYLKAFEWFHKFYQEYETGELSEENFDSRKNSFLQDVMNLLVAVDINTNNEELSDKLCQLLLDIGINKSVLDDARKKRRMTGTSVYVIADSVNCSFLLCAGNQQPKRWEYDDKKRTLWLDFKRKCNCCIFKDCKGYRQSGTFEMRI